MKTTLEQLLNTALATVLEKYNTTLAALPAAAQSPQITRTKEASHGDFATNLALMLAKPLQQKPQDIAQALVDALPADKRVEKINIAGPGFINFYMAPATTQAIVSDILTQKNCFGRNALGQGKSVYLEFVSANPTGPLHVGHGRGAALGATLGNVLENAGYTVHREYYVNDAGRQMSILTLSIFLRYLKLCGETIAFPENAYQGDYIIEIATQLFKDHEMQFQLPSDTLLTHLPETDDKDIYIDAMIENIKNALGKDFEFLLEKGVNAILTDIRDDLAEFGVNFQEWYSEKDLLNRGGLEKAIETLKASGHLYEDNGALWFASTQFEDDKDRVLVKGNGSHTYFLPDIAYHLEKFSGPYDMVIDIFGADHHGYIARMHAAMQAANIDLEKFKILLVQFAVLYRGKTKVQMSTRSGEFVTLRQLRDEVGKDAARYYYIMRRNEQHMDFDLELAKSKSNENPVYYVQYAHARICSVFKQAAEKNIEFDEAVGLNALASLTEPHEQQLMETLACYPEVMQKAVTQLAPHLIPHYLQTLSAQFHAYYNAHKFIIDDVNHCQARLCLIQTVKHVLVNALTVIGVSAPEVM